MNGYNCAQSVAAAFSDVVGLDDETMMRLAAAFGGGFARTRNICGTISAVGMILGLKYADSTADGKADIYALTRELTDKFIAENGSIVCGELLRTVKGITSTPQPDERTAEYYKKRPCLKYVMAAVDLLDEKLGEF